ncbi:intradiol ring-cleavage dioxygenase [Deinococcus sp. YIM 77859]|uniref:intradiol ring-cleavage dioxygenase n=1 Tax=Deinococcus sp. YIM 77859 TaxID=1540221 RepID=UPI000551727E|nr:intradiol ring-cleavage dioxygenase [Deinococcus sp. YIM 77859]
MDNDDAMVGTLLSRRRALALLGLGGGALATTGLMGCNGTAAGSGTGTGGTGTALPSCVVRPALTEGPYFVDTKLQRSDIRSDTGTGTIQLGVPLSLTFQITRVGSGGCTPLGGVMVDLWQCNALGVYSGVSGNGQPSTVGQDFLRGYQLTDARGEATFTTIYPGWYPGRTPHLHFKLRVLSASGSTQEFTSQLFFEDALSDTIYRTVSPYATKGANRSVRNANDNIYQNGGSQLLLTLSGDAASGYRSTIDIGMNIA